MISPILREVTVTTYDMVFSNVVTLFKSSLKNVSTSCNSFPNQSPRSGVRTIMLVIACKFEQAPIDCSRKNALLNK